jgi:hypothetical protein
MTNRVTFGVQDFQTLPKQIERDHESKRLIVLMERVKRQIAARTEPGSDSEAMKRPATAVGSDSTPQRLSMRSVTVPD